MTNLPPTPQEASIEIRYGGYGFIFDAAIQLFANDYFLGTLYAKSPYQTTFYVSPGEIQLKAKFKIGSRKISLSVLPGRHYIINLLYDGIWRGWYFKLVES